ncbi:ATP phosphoribosyltransferase [Caldibacillus lycopersici]|uniref:ATP phosphoribosyltransferase n=1 Tax=Perspicuibacillus lycopersici TaxID=1325689 RepID=A0AAE3LQR5_9BACI|nr:ATP phosphoribosyltransferase [Perspicuibacillus lycopersici]MCU9613794.1 ATP phosphoribosyltransferase [Perspicuibacillus lycopersici]
MTYINIALGKGRLVDKTISLLKEMGIDFCEYHSESRKLIFEDPKNYIRIVLVKAVDVPTYVEKGAADIGVVGKDTLLESGANVFEMVNLGFGNCKFVVAGCEQLNLYKKKLIVATKYPNVAKKYFNQQGRSIEVIKLNGSVELAPLVGLSDCIVDIVETGTTLKENGLKILEEICPISARLIVNKASYKTNFQQVNTFLEKLQAIINRLEVNNP